MIVDISCSNLCNRISPSEDCFHDALEYFEEEGPFSACHPGYRSTEAHPLSLCAVPPVSGFSECGSPSSGWRTTPRARPVSREAASTLSWSTNAATPRYTARHEGAHSLTWDAKYASTIHAHTHTGMILPKHQEPAAQGLQNMLLVPSEALPDLPVTAACMEAPRLSLGSDIHACSVRSHRLSCSSITTDASERAGSTATLAEEVKSADGDGTVRGEQRHSPGMAANASVPQSAGCLVMVYTPTLPATRAMHTLLRDERMMVMEERELASAKQCPPASGRPLQPAAGRGTSTSVHARNDSTTHWAVTGSVNSPRRVPPCTSASGLSAAMHRGLSMRHVSFHGGAWDMGIVNRLGFTVAVHTETTFYGITAAQLADIILMDNKDLFDIYGVKAYEPQALTPSKHGDSLGYSETRVVMTAKVRVMWIKMAFTQTLLACKQWRDAEGKPCAAPTQQAASTAPGTGSASSQAAILASVAAGDAAANASLGADGGTPPHDRGQSSPAMAGASAGEALACQLEFKLLKSDNAKKFEGVFDLRELRDEETGRVLGVKASYEVAVSPKGVPPGVHRLPVVSHAMQTTSLGQAQQLTDKISYVAAKVQAGLSVPHALRDTMVEVRAAGGKFKALMTGRMGRSYEGV